jgi:Anion-transporting ATPase
VPGHDATLRFAMDVRSFCAQSQVVIVAGKGGVGRTTVTATLAHAAARAGLRVLVVELEGRPGLPAAFGHEAPLTYTESELFAPGPGSVVARWVTPDEALLEYLGDHGLQRVSRRLLSSGVVDVVATAIPGIRDVLILGKVKQLERAGSADLIVLDAPATGHAVALLTAATGLLGSARAGPLRAQAEEVVAMLSDPARCQVLLTTIPEETPVSETIEAAYLLEDRVGVRLGPIVLNMLDVPPAALRRSTAEAAEEAGVELSAPQLAGLEEARAFRVRRSELQAEQVDRLVRELPLPQLRLPELWVPAIGPAELRILSAELSDALMALPTTLSAP